MWFSFPSARPPAPFPLGPARARDPDVDALRGFAIVAMVAANMAAHSLRDPHPGAFRVYGSLAAPTFIFLSGMMAGERREAGRLGLARAVKRALLLLGWAVALDVVVWRVAPFETFDVLYVIGLALPAVWLCGALSPSRHALVAVSVLLLTPWLQHRLGYRLSFADETPGQFFAWRRLLVDGWFPAFPWLGVALTGALLGRLRRVGSPLAAPRARLVLSAVLGAGGVLLWLAAPLPFPTRSGYSELFYPPSLAVVSMALAVVLALLGTLPSLRLPLGWLALLGRASLTLYVVHCVVVAFVTKKWFADRPLPEFTLLYFGHLLLLGALARVLTLLRGAGFLARRGVPR
jgi:uncharacterized membrane protein